MDPIYSRLYGCMKVHYTALLLIPCALQAQYSGPESIEHDPVGQRYFISNTGNNSISQRAMDGTVSPFVSNLPAAPYGLELKGDTLFACMGGFIRGYRTADGTPVFNLALGAAFLNGIATDGVFLYASDFSGKKIFKVDVAAMTFTTLVSNTVSTPNGIVWDAAMQRLWVVNWGGNAKIKSYDRNTGAELGSYITELTNLDGIALDCQGRIVVSSWQPARLTRFENTFTQAPEILTATGLDNPADLDYDAVNNRVCVPNSGSNSVVLHEIADCTANVMEQAAYSTFNVWPNPTGGLLRVDLQLQEAVPFLVFNARGTLVASGELRPNGQLDITELAPGTYLLDIPRLRKSAKFIKK